MRIAANRVVGAMRQINGLVGFCKPISQSGPWLAAMISSGRIKSSDRHVELGNQ
jgi:hypothetical protein